MTAILSEDLVTILPGSNYSKIDVTNFPKKIQFDHNAFNF